MTSEHELDTRIEHLLRDEPFREVPSGFAVRVQRRVRAAALLREEQKRFRLIVAASGLLTALLLAAVAGGAWLGSPETWAPGRFTSLPSYLQSLTEGAGATGLLSASLTLGIVLLLGSAAALPSFTRQHARR